MDWDQSRQRLAASSQQLTTGVRRMPVVFPAQTTRQNKSKIVSTAECRYTGGFPSLLFIVTKSRDAGCNRYPTSRLKQQSMPITNYRFGQELHGQCAPSIKCIHGTVPHHTPADVHGNFMSTHPPWRDHIPNANN